MKKVSDKFDSLDDKLDDLETKRGQLSQVLCHMCYTVSSCTLLPMCCYSGSDITEEIPRRYQQSQLLRSGV